MFSAARFARRWAGMPIAGSPRRRRAENLPASLQALSTRGRERSSDKPMREASPHRPDIHIAPPIVFMAGFLFGFLLDRYLIAMRISGAASRSVALVGLVMMVAGAVLAIAGVLAFRR